MSAIDLSQLVRNAGTPVGVVAEIRPHLPGTAGDIAAKLHQSVAYVLETLNAMQVAGIVVASNDDPPVWSQLRLHCASSGQA